jgi:hypothetical protein
MSDPTADRIDRLLDAIEFVQSDQREQARALLRGLISENGDFEDAWLWMSVAVDSFDQSAVCLENVLRINPDNQIAAGALYQLRASDIAQERRRSRLRFWRDMALIVFWLLLLTLLFALLFHFFARAESALEALATLTTTPPTLQP